MSKLYVRIDDRLIHGQIVTSWVKTLDIKRIIAIDDTIAGNEMMKSIVTMGVPSHIESLVIKKSQLVDYLDSDKVTLIIVRFARDLDSLFEYLKDAVHINIGNCSKQANPVLTTKAKGVGQLLSFTQEDVDALDRYDNYGTEVIAQQLPMDKITTWKHIEI
jgi:mannose/fructose/N-acetylgalactosamine-specific phosphotransferase system component IIB